MARSSSLNAWPLYFYILLTTTSCTAVSNTIAGLTTPQSTISGSNYVFLVNPETGRLTTRVPDTQLGDSISAGDYFRVSLDFGFLRYLQAVDPYVIVYSETWMGTNPKPTESEQTNRQVVLIKEGLAQNAKLPITSVSLLGPVTLGDDMLEVHVTLKVVVLSKRDNAQTIQLVEGLAGVAGSVAPQYAVAAGAAAATVSAFISQNRDKVEFEHSFTFSPHDDSDGSTRSLADESFLTLREGMVAVIKGESRYRVVPYHTWYYYLWPFNWFGQSTDEPSRRYESDEVPRYTFLGEAIRLPAYVIGGFFSDSRADAFFGNVIPFPFLASEPIGTPLTHLAVDGYNLVKCPEAYQLDDVGIYTSVTAFRAEAIKAKKEHCNLGELYMTRRRTPSGNLLGSLLPLSLHRPVVVQNLFSEKTHMVLSISKTSGTFGTFGELVAHFSEHAKRIDGVTTSSSEAQALSTESVKKVFEVVQEAVLYSRARQLLRNEAQKGIIATFNGAYFTDIGLASVTPNAKDSLVKASIEAHARKTERDFRREIARLSIPSEDAQAKRAVQNGEPSLDKSPLEAMAEKSLAIKAPSNKLMTDRPTSDNPTSDRPEFDVAGFQSLTDYITDRAWTIDENTEDKYRIYWMKAWERVLEVTRNNLWLNNCKSGCFDSAKWKALKDLVKSQPAVLPATVPQVSTEQRQPM